MRWEVTVFATQIIVFSLTKLEPACPSQLSSLSFQRNLRMLCQPTLITTHIWLKMTALRSSETEFYIMLSAQRKKYSNMLFFSRNELCSSLKKTSKGACIQIVLAKQKLLQFNPQKYWTSPWNSWKVGIDMQKYPGCIGVHIKKIT